MSEDGSVFRFFGAILVALGALIAVLCGGCTAIFVGIGLFEIVTGKSRGEDVAILFTFLFVGGIPFLVGVGLLLAGRAIRRSAK